MQSKRSTKLSYDPITYFSNRRLRTNKQNLRSLGPPCEGLSNLLRKFRGAAEAKLPLVPLGTHFPAPQYVWIYNAYGLRL